MYRESHLPKIRILESVILSELTREEISQLKDEEMLQVISDTASNMLGAIKFIRKLRSKTLPPPPNTDNK